MKSIAAIRIFDGKVSIWKRINQFGQHWCGIKSDDIHNLITQSNHGVYANCHRSVGCDRVPLSDAKLMGDGVGIRRCSARRNYHLVTELSNPTDLTHDPIAQIPIVMNEGAVYVYCDEPAIW